MTTHGNDGVTHLVLWQTLGCITRISKLPLGFWEHKKPPSFNPSLSTQAINGGTRLYELPRRHHFVGVPLYSRCAPVGPPAGMPFAKKQKQSDEHQPRKAAESLSSWTNNQLVVAERMRALEGFEGFIALTFDKEWMKNHPCAPTLAPPLKVSTSKLGPLRAQSGRN